MPAEADVARGSSRRRPAVLALAGGLVLVAAVAAAVVLLARSDDHVLGELGRAFSQPVGSANVKLEAELRVDGSPQVPGPLRLRLAGPYRSGASRTIPALDWNVLLSGPGRTLSTRLISTTENAFVVFQEVAYEVGAGEVADVNRRIEAGRRTAPTSILRALGIEPRRWLVEPDDEGDESIGGVATHHYAARVDAARLLDDLQGAAARAAPQVGRPPPPPLTDFQRRALRSVFAAAALDAYVEEDGGRLRLLVLRAPFAIPPESRAQAGGATGGLLYLSVALDPTRGPVVVVPPPDARPIEDLRRQIQPLGAPPGL